MFRMVDFEMILPSLRSSPTMRRAPHRGLLVFISITRFRTSSSVAGRPGGFWRKVHLRAAIFRCHARTVFGDTVTILPKTLSFRRSIETKKNRCHDANFVRLAPRFSTCNYLRSTSISCVRRAGVISQINWRMETSKVTKTLPCMARP